jgi:hypothetical protein
MADHASLPDRTHGHFLKGKYSKVFEFKPKAGRVYAFFFERNCYLTHGARKKKDKEQVADHDRALALRDDFVQRLLKARSNKQP